MYLLFITVSNNSKEGTVKKYMIYTMEFSINILIIFKMIVIKSLIKREIMSKFGYHFSKN